MADLLVVRLERGRGYLRRLRAMPPRPEGNGYPYGTEVEEAEAKVDAATAKAEKEMAEIQAALVKETKAKSAATAKADKEKASWGIAFSDLGCVSEASGGRWVGFP